MKIHNKGHKYQSRSKTLRRFNAMEYFLWTIIIAVGIFAPSDAAINAVVDFNLKGEGFHRTLRYTINLDGLNQSDCTLALHTFLPPEIYVNVDETADLNRLGKTLACSVGEIDVELFAEKASSQNVTICEELKNPFQTVSLSLPVHQRYKFSEKDGGHVAVQVPKPKLLLGCKERLRDHRVSDIDLCSPCDELARKWREIPYEMESGDQEWLIPVGNASLLTKVSYVTLMITSLGAAAVLQVLLRLKSRG